jgi:uncharacterized Tic20 family protein
VFFSFPRMHFYGGPLTLLVLAIAYLVALTAYACLWLAFVIVVGPFILWARRRAHIRA